MPIFSLMTNHWPNFRRKNVLPQRKKTTLKRKGKALENGQNLSSDDEPLSKTARKKGFYKKESKEDSVLRSW